MVPTTTIVLSHFANFKLAGDRAVRDTIQSLTPAPQSNEPPQRRRRPRLRRRATRRPVHTLSDADLEAELAARRAERARERDRFAKNLRSEKLSRLEAELLRLRGEISRLHPPPGRPTSGTPPVSQWASLPQRGRAGSVLGMPSSSVIPGASSSAPPMTPPPMGGEEDDIVVDPEIRRREKEERQRRREAKRKEREAAKKPLTLADIIRGAGPDPMSRLKPSGSTALPDVHEVEAEATKKAFAYFKDSLKKSEKEKPAEGTSAEDTVDDEKDKQEDKTGDLENVGNGKKSGTSEEAKVTEDVKISEKTNTEVNGEKEGEILEGPSDAPAGVESSDTVEEANSKSDAMEVTMKNTEQETQNDKVKAPSPASPMRTNTPSLDQLKVDKPASPSVEPIFPQTSSSPPVPTGPSTPPKDQAVPTITAAEASSVLAALTASLPTNTAKQADAVQPDGKQIDSRSRRRIALEEKRRLRRASSGKAPAQDMRGEGGATTELKDVLAAADALKID